MISLTGCFPAILHPAGGRRPFPGNAFNRQKKAHIAVDAATGLTEKVVTTAAIEHDLNQAENLITEPVDVVFTDAGYRGRKSGSH